MSRCNAYGAENKSGQAVVFGGFLDNPVAVQPECHDPAVHRFRWVCACGHSGQIVDLCEWHHAEFMGLPQARGSDGRIHRVPVNVRRNVQSCPRCASLAERPEAQHKCAVRLVTVS